MSENKKFALTSNALKGPFAPTVFQIRALIDIPEHGVKKDDLGGYVASEANLSHEGTCWVKSKAIIYDAARVSGDALVSGYAQVKDQSSIEGKAKVRDAAKVSGNAQIKGKAIIMDNAVISGHAKIFESALIKGFLQIHGDASIFGNAITEESAAVMGHACVFGNAKITEHATIAGNAEVFGYTRVSDNAVIESGSFNLQKTDSELTDHQFPSPDHRLDPEHPRFEPDLFSQLEQQRYKSMSQ